MIFQTRFQKLEIMGISLNERVYNEPQIIWSAVGLHGAGGYRAQCGLVEGALMFIGIYFHALGKTKDEIVCACYNFASAFEQTFGSLRCIELRSTGFSENNPSHRCENLTCNGIEFAYQYILRNH